MAKTLSWESTDTYKYCSDLLISQPLYSSASAWRSPCTDEGITKQHHSVALDADHSNIFISSQTYILIKLLQTEFAIQCYRLYISMASVHRYCVLCCTCSVDSMMQHCRLTASSSLRVECSKGSYQGVHRVFAEVKLTLHRSLAQWRSTVTAFVTQTSEA